MSDDDNDKVNENFSRVMDEYNLLHHEKAEAFKKLAEALNDKFQGRLTENRNTDENTRKNKPETKLNN